MRRLGPFLLLALLGSAPWLVAAAASGAGLGGSFQPTARDAGVERARPVLETERWLYNPRERAAAGLAALDEGRTEEAVEAFDTAAELARERPEERAWALFDAGAARLLAEGDAGRAIELLEGAAEGSPPELAPSALYNLGNARLAGGDPRGAIDAYRRALRLAPGLAPAKRNLEIAWTRLASRRPDEEPPPERPQGEPPREQEPPGESGSGEPPATPGQEREAAEAGPEPEPGPSGSEEEPRPPAESRAAPAPRPFPGEPAAPPLQRFREQPDMTAEQAAALLAAIDHLERSQRRQEAAERALRKARRTTEKDW